MCGSVSPITAGAPGLKMPAFSRAISSSVAPRYSVWSRPIDVTPATSGHHDVRGVEPSAESRFDRPRRRPRRARSSSNAIAVVASKKLAPISLDRRQVPRDELDDVVRRNRLARRRPCARGSRRGAATCTSPRAVPCAASSAVDRRHAAALPVRAGDVQHRIRSVRIAEAREQRDGALEAELVAAGRSREQEVERVLIAGERSRLHTVRCRQRAVVRATSIPSPPDGRTCVAAADSPSA